jgi:lipopolysaccharide export LptBFGC system permease protein LptF
MAFSVLTFLRSLVTGGNILRVIWTWVIVLVILGAGLDRLRRRNKRD